jgi:hypothetical protein
LITILVHLFDLFIHSDANRRLHTDPSMFINPNKLLLYYIHYLDYDPRTLHVPDEYLNSITPVSCIRNAMI